MIEAAAIPLAYLWGAIPTAYVLARLRKGIDIRRYGTGNVGAANVIAHVGLKTGVGLGVFDGVVKGALPVVAARLAGLGPWTQVGIALATVVGHNWSPYLRFAGGRGVASAMGAYVGFYLWQEILVGLCLVGLVGWITLRNLALWMLIGMSLMVPLSLLLGQPLHVTAVLLGLLALVVLKRLTANWAPPLEGEPLARVSLARFLYDRDVADHREWVSRRPGGEAQTSGL
jgi:glycerol-3-phosphate acyltransferase PlsY